MKGLRQPFVHDLCIPSMRLFSAMTMWFLSFVCQPALSQTKEESRVAAQVLEAMRRHVAPQRIVWAWAGDFKQP